MIPSIQKLVARSNVLNGFVAQYEFLEKYNVTPTDFENQVALLAPTTAVDGFIVLKPAETWYSLLTRKIRRLIHILKCSHFSREWPRAEDHRNWREAEPPLIADFHDPEDRTTLLGRLDSVTNGRF